jgi:putative ABC transport system substrate-binding protein
MRALGWIEGRNIAYDRVYANDHHQELPKLALALAARKPDLIYAPPQPAAVAAKAATRSIPIVFSALGDPVGTGLVSSLAQPGGNVTGVVSVVDSLAPKRVELLREIMPAKRVGLVGDPADPRLRIDATALKSAFPARDLTVLVAEAKNPTEFENAVASLIAQRIVAILSGATITANLRERLIDLANRARIPVVGHGSYMAESGALFSYGSSRTEQLRRSAHLVDKVLRGAHPSTIAVEQPTRFELVINLKAAKALGITIPNALLRRADEVIK